MNPLEKEIADLQQQVKRILLVEDVSFIQALIRRLSEELILGLSEELNIPENLSDLSDVSTSSPAAGEVLKYNGSTWAPGTDNIE